MADRGQALRDAFKRFDAALAVVKQEVEESMKCRCRICNGE